MTPADPYPVLRLLQSHLEGRLRQGGSRLWLSAEAAENLRDIVRMKPKPRPVTAVPVPQPALVSPPVQAEVVIKSEVAMPASVVIPPAVEKPAPVQVAAPAAKVEPLEHPQRLVLPEAPVVRLSKAEKKERLSALRARVEANPAARDLESLREVFVFGVGNPEAEIVLMGDAPGAAEERQGEPFVGLDGQLLTKVLKVMGLDRSQVYLTTLCKYRPAMDGQDEGDERAPTMAEMQTGFECVREELALIQPKAVVALGGAVIRGLLDVHENVLAVRGRFYEFEGLPVMATLHPAWLLEKESEGAAVAIAEKRKFWEDMMRVMEKVGLPVSEKQRAFFLPK